MVAVLLFVFDENLPQQLLGRRQRLSRLQLKTQLLKHHRSSRTQDVFHVFRVLLLENEAKSVEVAFKTTCDYLCHHFL